ncbi:MAG: VacJ family lipoprotein [Burkholderiales bacterium]|nr:VacJ family lipoprotein [Burkholderiales bacterium]
MSAQQTRARQLIAVTLIIVAGALSGCAHNNVRDPLEPLNRGVYAFNDVVDNLVLKPAATGYRALLPQIVRTGVSNFFSNLDDITVVINNVLQLKIPQALSDTGRFLINSTVGVLGLIDVATHLGLEKHNEDFGQTLGYWGVGNGPYLVLPFLGPSTLRDGVGRWADWRTDVVLQLDHVRTRNQLWGTRILSNRAHLLDTEKVLDAAAIDRYAFIRDAYLQRRRNLVYDGNPPPEPEDDDVDGKSKPKPRSERNEIPPAVLVDSYGNRVAGPAAETPRAQARNPAGSAGAPAPEPARPMTSPTSQGPALDVPVGAASAPPPPQAAVEPARADQAPRVVRIWLR